MKRSKELERVLQWCYGMDYAHAYDAINAYCAERDLTWKRSLDNIIVYVPINVPFDDGLADIDAYEKRVRELEAEGCTRSDAQAIADAEDALDFTEVQQARIKRLEAVIDTLHTGLENRHCNVKA